MYIQIYIYIYIYIHLNFLYSIYIWKLIAVLIPTLVTDELQIERNVSDDWERSV